MRLPLRLPVSEAAIAPESEASKPLEKGSTAVRAGPSREAEMDLNTQAGDEWKAWKNKRCSPAWLAGLWRRQAFHH